MSVGYLVLSDEKLMLTDIQQLALNDIRPMFASVLRVSPPPPFGDSQRTICVRVDPNRLRSRRLHGSIPYFADRHPVRIEMEEDFVRVISFDGIRRGDR